MRRLAAVMLYARPPSLSLPSSLFLSLPLSLSVFLSLSLSLSFSLHPPTPLSLACSPNRHTFFLVYNSLSPPPPLAPSRSLSLLLALLPPPSLPLTHTRSSEKVPEVRERFAIRLERQPTWTIPPFEVYHPKPCLG